MEQLYIRALGEFTLCYGENYISDSDSRSKKVWMLIAYLLCHRTRIIPGRELIRVLWGDDPSNSNPENTLKVTFHRARTQLNQLWATAGHDLLLNRDGGYCWNNEISLAIDAEEFEQGCLRDSVSDEESWLLRAMSALEHYKGSFLPKLGAEIWLIPHTSHYHNIYIQTVLDAALLLADRGRHEEAVAICRKAIAEEPYHEPLYQRLMLSLIEMGDQTGATAVYDELSQRLMNDFGIYPAEETTAVYRTATNAISDRSLSIEVVQEHLKDDAYGAMECEYDYFRVLCHAESRSMLRTGRIAHIALFSIGSKTDKPLSKRSHDRVMELYGEHIRGSLRRGDAYARCSTNQYIVMLPDANYENSNMVCRRVIAAFQAEHPHSPAKINFLVQPLTSNGIALRED